MVHHHGLPRRPDTALRGLICLTEHPKFCDGTDLDIGFVPRASRR